MFTQFILYLLQSSAETVHACSASLVTNTVNGVLVKTISYCPDGGKVAPDFFDYIHAVLQQNTTYIVTIAVIIIVASGLQYMLAFGSSGSQTKAKERIIGVVIGIVFFTLISFLIAIISNGISLGT